MDSNEARMVLRAYRPAIDAGGDEQIAAALEQVRRDPELAAWWEQECVLHEALRAKFQQVPVPADLRDRILAGAVVVALIPWWRRRFAIAAAAAVVLLVAAGAAVWKFQTRDAFAPYRTEMTQFVDELYNMNVQATGWEELHEAFAKKGWPSEFTIPAGLRANRLKGGCVLYWKEEKVSLVCMETETRRGVWLFIKDQGTLPAVATVPGSRVEKVGHYNTTTWTTGDKLYLLVTKGSEEELKQVL